MEFVNVAVARPMDQLYTYAIPSEWSDEIKNRLQPGFWVEVPFGKQVLAACVIDRPERVQIDSSKIRNLSSVLDESTQVPKDVFDLCRWAARFYQTSLGELLQSALPSAVLRRAAMPTQRKTKDVAVAAPTPIELNADQKRALDVIEQSSKPVLLHGVTGSGKTEVYIEAAKRVLSAGKSVCILVPEIALTPQLLARFEKGLGVEVALWHSALTDVARARLWLRLKRGEIRAVVGARSAVFAPLTQLGLIVVDEEHDASYKQEERGRYHARDLALVRANIHGAKVILGSATPSLETLDRVEQGKFECARIQARFGAAVLPEIHIVDLAQVEKREDSQALFATETLEEMARTLDRGEQVIVFLNRRGFAAVMICEDCGWSPECPHCSLSLTVHRQSRVRLRCHICGHQRQAPDSCEKCQGHGFHLLGAGTESLEEQLPKLIPAKTEIKSVRLDRDRVTSHSRLEAILNTFRSGEANLLLGTQMLVKGHDFPSVTLVVIVLADGLFRFPDFRAAERAYQILTQVSGRAGRHDKPGKVWIQTFQPDHPVLDVLTGKASIETWLESERDLRKEFHYPPYWRMARVRVESQSSPQGQEFAELLGTHMGSHGQEILGPSEAPIGRVKTYFRWDLWVKSPRIEGLHAALQDCLRQPLPKGCRIHVDVDPQSL